LALKRSGVAFFRNKKKARAAAESIKTVSGNQDVHSFAADLSSMAQVRKLAAEVKNAHPKINVLSNNAGVFAERMQVGSKSFTGPKIFSRCMVRGTLSSFQQ